MAVMKDIAEKRMRALVFGGMGWMGAVNYAKSITSGPPHAPPGSPPGMRGEIGPGKPTYLMRAITGNVTRKGRTVVGMVYSLATRKGVSYPMLLELGMGVGKRPWLKPTGKVTTKAASKMMSEGLTTDEQKKIGMKLESQLSKQSLTVETII